jgi:hypothetical protein
MLSWLIIGHETVLVITEIKGNRVWETPLGESVVCLGLCFSLGPWPAATYWGYLILLNLYFLISGMGIIMVIGSQSCCENQLNNTSERLSIVPSTQKVISI